MLFVWPNFGELGMKVCNYLRIAKAIAAANSTALDCFGGCRAQQDIVKGQAKSLESREPAWPHHAIK